MVTLDKHKNRELIHKDSQARLDTLIIEMHDISRNLQKIECNSCAYKTLRYLADAISDIKCSLKTIEPN